MKIGNFAVAAGAAGLMLALWNIPGNAQGPLWDRVNVNLPYTVTIGDKTLQPGSYVIQQLDSPSGSSRVLLIYSDNGMKYQTNAMTIPTLDKSTAKDTQVILHHYGQDYYFDKVWVQGKDYGYEFPLPDNIKQREKEKAEPVSVAASYQSTSDNMNSKDTANTTTSANAATLNANPPAVSSDSLAQSQTVQPQTAQSQSTESQSTTQSQTMAQTTTPLTPRTDDLNTANREMQDKSTQSQSTQSQTMAQTTQSQRSDDVNSANREMQAQTTPPPVSSTPQSSTPQSTTPTTTDANSANRDSSTSSSPMPNTSAGWLMMLLSGGALSGAGLSLRRRKQ